MMKKIVQQYIEENPIILLKAVGITDFPSMKTQIIVRCPLHKDNSPSLSLNLQKCIWNCFAGCGSGSFIKLYSVSKNLNSPSEFPLVLREIADLYTGGKNDE